MVSLLIGLFGIVAGLVALALNLILMKPGRTSQGSRNHRFLMVWSSVVGLVICLATFVIGIEGVTVEGLVLYYGWPFVVATTDFWQSQIGSEWIVGDLAFWLLAPQILVLIYDRVFRTRRRSSQDEGLSRGGVE